MQRQPAQPSTLDVVTGSSVKWELLVAESEVPANFPSLSIAFPVGAFPLLVGDTYADGSASLPTFTPTKPYWIQYACMGTGSITILSSDGSVDYTSESCNASPGINGLLVPKNQVTGQPVSLRIATTQSTTWAARVVQFSGAAPKPYEIVPPTPAPVEVPIGFQGASRGYAPRPCHQWQRFHHASDLHAENRVRKYRAQVLRTWIARDHRI